MSLRPSDEERRGGEVRARDRARGRAWGEAVEGKVVAEVRPHREVGTEPKAICISHRVF